MSDSEIVISFQSERNLWYVQRGDATAVISAEDMVNEYHRWHRTGRAGEWRRNAEAFCRQRIEADAIRSQA
jgi:hypothetical protein